MEQKEELEQNVDWNKKKIWKKLLDIKMTVCYHGQCTLGCDGYIMPKIRYLWEWGLLPILNIL